MAKKIYLFLTNKIFKTCYDFIGGLAIFILGAQSMIESIRGD